MPLRPVGHTINKDTTQTFQHICSVAQWLHSALYVVKEKTNHMHTLSSNTALLGLNHKPRDSLIIFHADFSIIQLSGMSV